MSERTDQLASGLDNILERFDSLSVDEMQQQINDLVEVVRGMDQDELSRGTTVLRDASNESQERLHATEQKRNLVADLARVARNRLDALQRASAQRQIQ